MWITTQNLARDFSEFATQIRRQQSAAISVISSPREFRSHHKPPSCKTNRRTSKEIVMIALEQKRRSFLLGLGSIGINQLLVQGVPPAQVKASKG